MYNLIYITGVYHKHIEISPFFFIDWVNNSCFVYSWFTWLIELANYDTLFEGCHLTESKTFVYSQRWCHLKMAHSNPGVPSFHSLLCLVFSYLNLLPFPGCGCCSVSVNVFLMCIGTFAATLPLILDILQLHLDLVLSQKYFHGNCWFCRNG